MDDSTAWVRLYCRNRECATELIRRFPGDVRPGMTPTGRHVLVRREALGDVAGRAETEMLVTRYVAANMCARIEKIKEGSE